MYSPWGLFSMLCFLRFNEVSREWLSLCPLSCNSSALIAWFCLEGNLYSLVFCLPFGGTNCSVLNKIFQFIRLALVKGLSELRGNEELERQVQHEVRPVYDSFGNNTPTLTGSSRHETSSEHANTFYRYFTGIY